MRALALLSLLAASAALAAPLATLTDGATSLTLHDEPCRLRETVSNLAGRATWTEAGKTTEACYGMTGQTVVVYFAVDRTIALLPASAFRPVSRS
jgi:hypothetical protein